MDISTYGEARTLKAECNQVQKVDKLTEYQTLCRSVLFAQVRQLFNQRFNLRRWSPFVHIKAAQYTLTYMVRGFSIDL